MARKGRAGGGMTGGLGKQLVNGIWLLLIIGMVYGLVKANGLTDVGSVVDYARSWSDKAAECSNKTAEAETVVPCGDGEGSGGTDDGSDPATGEPGTGGSTDESPIGIPTTKTEAEKDLVAVPVIAKEEIDYSRSEWKHWSDKDKDGCDAREETLISQGKSVQSEKGTCKILSGLWVDPYSGKKIEDSSTIDIDHIVPLSYAARFGGQKWDATTKEQFANDPINLLASSATENRRKGDSGPSEYMPPRAEFTCSYSNLWIQVVKKYSLSIAAEDKKALKEGLSSCA